MTIKKIQGLQIIDSRGNPTVRAYVELSDGSILSSSVPSGASVGKYEDKEIRDNIKSKFFGLGVEKVVDNINTHISKALVDRNIQSPEIIDEIMLNLDNTPDKSILGANALLAVSQAIMKATAHYMQVPLWKCINTIYFPRIEPAFPRLFINVINGGRHANWNFDIQEFVVIPKKNLPSKSVRIGVEIFQSIKKELMQRGLSVLVGDEGGESPAMGSNEQVFDLIITSAVRAKYALNVDFDLGIDTAASELFRNNKYEFKKDNTVLTSNQLEEKYIQYNKKYHVSFFEDPFAENDWDAFTDFTDHSDKKYTVIGDDLFATDIKRIQKGINLKSANAIIIKPNQTGTILETVEAIKIAKNSNWKTIISHRSGDTEDTFIADLAFGCGSDFIKTGSMSRSERLAKYNRLLEIEAFEA